MKNKYNLLLKIIKDKLKHLIEWVIKERYALSFGLHTILMVSLLYTDISFVIKILLVMAINIVLCVSVMLYWIDREMNLEVPSIKKRLTYKDSSGNISIDEEDWPEAILYLNEIENYIENRYL